MPTQNLNAPSFFKGNPGQTPGNNSVDIHVVSGQVSGENLILTMSNSTTVTISLSSVFDYNEVSGLSFSEDTRTLTLNQQGRSFSAVIPGGSMPNQDSDIYVTSGTVSGDTMTLTRENADDLTIDLSPFERHTHRDITGVISIDDNDVASFNEEDAVNDVDVELNSEGQIGLKDGGIVNAKLVHDSVTINNMTVALGGAITIPTGGDNPGHGDNSKFNFSVSPSSVETGSADQTATVTLSLNTGYSLTSTTVTATDVDNADVTVTTVTENSSYTFPLSAANSGRYTVQATGSIVRASDNAMFEDTVTKHVLVEAGWYAGRRNSAPTSLADLTNEGVWDGNEDYTAPTGTDPIYFFMPTGTYTFTDGQTFIDDTVLSDSVANYDLIRINDNIVAGTTFNISEG